MFPRWVWDYIRSVGGEVYAEVRGWRLDIVAPRYRYRPSVSEVTDPCPTWRSVWLRRVGGVRVEAGVLAVGRLVHRAVLEALRRRFEPLRLLANPPEWLEGAAREYPWLLRLYEEAVVLAKASVYDGVPVAVEPPIPGAPVGLSDVVKPDVLVGFIPVEVVYGNGLERKRLALAGYALAVEASMGHPVDYGVVMQVRVRGGEPRIDWHVVALDDGLRRRFLEARDEVARIVESGEDPGVADECPESCPFRGICRGGGGG